MKKIILFLLYICAALGVYSQNIISVAKSQRVDGKYENSARIDLLEYLDTVKILEESIRKMEHGRDSKEMESINTVRRLLESFKMEIVEESLTQRNRSLNNTSAVALIANGGISNIEEAKKAIGNISIGFQFRLTPYKVMGSSRWSKAHYLYTMFNTRTGSSDDAKSVIKTFIFPELNKRDFVLAFYTDFQNADWGVQPVAELSLNRYKDPEDTTIFRSVSFLAGFKTYRVFQLELAKNTTAVCLQAFPYYSLISVDPKYFSAYNSLLQEKNAPPTFHSIGMQMIVQIDKIAVFCNMKHVLNSARKIEQQDLKSFIYTVGSSISF